MNWYPLQLTLPTRNHIFGGSLIQEKLGKTGLQPRRLAETWEVSDVEEVGATVKNGELAGRTLRELTLAYPAELVGPGWAGQQFPLLTKFIDGTGMLPVHLHADDATARRKQEGPNGKTEAWHILWCADDATILAGLQDGVSQEQLHQALLTQDYDSVMRRLPIRPGDTVYVPGGGLHSFGPDTLIYEIEQTSNIQQTAMPWQMEDGTLYPEPEWHHNIDELLDEIHLDYKPSPHPGLPIEEGDTTRCFCCAGPYFALERVRIGSAYQRQLTGALIVSNIGEPTQVRYAGGVASLGKAESLLLPAALGTVTFAAGEVLLGYLPDLEGDVIAPLRAAGYAETDLNAFVQDK